MIFFVKHIFASFFGAVVSSQESVDIKGVLGTCFSRVAFPVYRSLSKTGVWFPNIQLY